MRASSTTLEVLLAIGREHGDSVVPLSPRQARTPVLMLARNAAPFLTACFDKMRRAVAKGCAEAGCPPPRWYVYENDSTDQTVALLKRYGDIVLCCDRLPQDQRPSGLVERSTLRCGPMARMRNALRVMALRDLAVVGATAILVDVDVWFSSRTIATLLRERRRWGLDVAAANTRETARHYYDTYALVLPDERPADVYARTDCYVSGCVECARRRKAGGVDAPLRRCVGKQDAAVTPVRSAFGGLAAVRAAAIRGKEEPWRSDAPGLCEHVALCEGKRVGIVNAATARWAVEYNKSINAVYSAFWEA